MFRAAAAGGPTTTAVDPDGKLTPTTAVAVTSPIAPGVTEEEEEEGNKCCGEERVD